MAKTIAKKGTLLITASITLLLSMLTVPLAGCNSKNVVSTTPKESTANLNEINYISVPSGDTASETNMLINGQANMIPTIGSLTEAENLKSGKNIQVLQSEDGSSTISCVFFNMRLSPMNNQSFRDAISRIVNRNYVTNTMLDGMAIPCSTFVPSLSDDWTDTAATAPAFDSVQAAKILDNAGYTFDTNAESRIDPSTNQPLNLTILTPLQGEYPVLWDIGYMLTYYLNELGIKAAQIALPDSLFQQRAMQSRDYDILVENIVLAPAPFGLYPLLDSTQDHTGTDDFSGIHDSALDADLEQLWTGLDLASDQKASYAVQDLLSQSLPYVAVCSVPVYSAVNGQWDNIVDMPGVGASNIWTYQSIQPTDKSQGQILNLTAPGGFDNLNPLVADNANDWSVLQQICSPLLYYDPVTMKDTPVLASSWDVTAWTTPSGGNGTKVTFHLVNGVKWQDGVPFTSQDIKFCIDFIKANNVPAFADITSLIDHVDAPDNLTVEIYLTDSGYRHLYDLAWFTFMPQHIWSSVTDYQNFKPWAEVDPANKNLTELIGQGPYILKPGDLTKGVQLNRNQSAYLAKP